MILCVFVFFVLMSSTFGEDDVIYPSMYEHQRLATRINCQVREPQHFHYSSITDLWGLMGGQIILEADVTLLCMGDDRRGKFEAEALKYRVEVTNLQLTEKKDTCPVSLSQRRQEKEEDVIDDKESMRRRKRGAGEFFSKSWDQIKQFFKRVFGRKTKEPEVTQVRPVDTTDERRETPTEEEPEEAFNMTHYDSMYSIPFQFVQLANGSIPEIRFSENEIDGRVKNFKRHLVDAFSTQLNFNQKQKAIVEKSVMGEHTSTYNITVNNPTASLSIAGISPMKAEDPTVVVKKLVTENDILQLAPSEALNDREKMNLKVQQMQVFKGGRMISSSGVSSLILLHDPDMKRNRIKRDAEDDITSYLQALSSFDIQLQKRQKRSTRQSLGLEKEDKDSYLPASRIAELEDYSKRRKSRLLQESTIDTAVLVEHMLNGNSIDYDEKMQVLFEMVEREVSLELDEKSTSVSSAVKNILSKEVMHEFCSKNFSVCKDFLQLLALAGGPEAEDVLLSFVTQENALSATFFQTVADILSDITRPSAHLLHSLGALIQNKSRDTEALGAMCLSLGHLGSKADVDEKKYVSRIFIDLLKEKKETCRSDPFIVDILEAIGNLDCENTVPDVLEVAALCRNNGAIQIACAHALRHSTHLSLVQEWIQNVTADGDCDILREVIGSLMDKIQDQEMTPDANLWPRFGFNEIDNLLRSYLNNSRCAIQDIGRYFKRKQNAEANDISRNFFGPESEPWDTESSVRHKRAAWDDLNCQEWTEDSKYRPIQDKEEFASDRATYNKRKSCLAFRRLGVKGANAEIYAGMFAGLKEPSDPPKYKLFTKFVSGLNFLGHQMEIGSFYFYHQSGRTKAYVRIMGRTRQEFTHEGCTPTDLRYRPLKHIPLFLVNVGTVQLSLGIHLSSQLAMDTACPDKEVYQLEPLTSVRIGGEAMGTVLFARGAVNLGGNFNYKLQFTFTPTPDMCLKGSHGYDPMNISFETYYQLWNAVKSDWGKPRTWRPSFLSWDVTNGDMKQWFDDTCIATEKSGSPMNAEREIE